MVKPMSRRVFLKAAGLAAAVALLPVRARAAQGKPRNIILIYADDLGYGDLGCYGATQVATPHIDRIAREGVRFVNAHSTSATCTPSRYALLTGEYPWRRQGTGILPGDARLIIEPGRTTLPALLQRAGYQTGVVGKWHLGLGAGHLDWNQDIAPGPLDIGFDYCFLIPATGDRVPCVYVEDRRVVGLDPQDPIQVSYTKPIGTDPTGRDHPELLKMHPSHGHDQTIVNGISRIGYMTGGQAARWVDEDIADTITRKATAFIEKYRAEPFFLYFSTHDIHVPRVPHPRFAGKSGLGPRGDVIVQLDEAVGTLLATLDRLGLAEDTLLIFSSDNGPVVDDGYRDRAVELLDGHRPAGPLRGGKYSAFDAGTRVPWIVRWPGQVRPGVSGALVSQVDLAASLAALTDQKLAADDIPDSLDVLGALLGRTDRGRDHLVEHAGVLSLIQGDWKYIEPGQGPRMNVNTNIELGNVPQPQLYHLRDDLGEKTNLAAEHPQRVREMAARLRDIRQQGRTRPGPR
ncbi:MAG: arylsulfatase [Planctomycetes bacterium]|jgi:arylsulfatase A-like enzyme|nr:arylsulfatase [Planctomycetota bacterium]